MKEDLLIYKTAQELAEVIAQHLVQHLQTLRNPEATPGNVQDEKPIGIKEACELLSVTEPTLRDWREKGLVPYRKIGDRYYFFRSELLGGMEQPQRRGRHGHTGSATGRRGQAA